MTVHASDVCRLAIGVRRSGDATDILIVLSASVSAIHGHGDFGFIPHHLQEPNQGGLNLILAAAWTGEFASAKIFGKITHVFQPLIF